MRLRRLAFPILLLAIAVPLPAAEHVRVVLDVSGSMQKNDPGRLAVLATLLLYDLASPNTTLGDSFEVLPFDQAWRWAAPGDPPPVSRRPRIAAEHGRRGDLVAALNGLPYDARMTYFYPGLRAAVEDLESTPGDAYDQRVVVLVTDGVPEPPTRRREAELIRRELVPRLEAGRIRLYVLAFSSEAYDNRDFFDEMVHGEGGASLGEVFGDPDGSSLLTNMLQIFARSFGYSPDAARSLPGVRSLDLDGGATPEKAAVVVLSPTPAPPPSLTLRPPPDGALNAPGGIKSAAEAQASYSLIWVLSPSPGSYDFDTNAVSGSVAVLRPTRLELEVLPAPPHNQAERTMASTPFHLKVRVHPATGSAGDPGAVNLSFRTHGERVRQPGGASGYAWDGDPGAPPPGPGTVTPEGRVYDVVATFRPHPEIPREVYVGYLELEARRGEAVVGSRTGPRAHRVEVHPLLSISPLPLSAYAANQALERRQEACTEFALTLNAGELPGPNHSLRAVLDPAVRLEGELKEATFTLDGLPLDVEGNPGPEPGAWYKGRPLEPETLLGSHEVCIQVGRPTAGNPGVPLQLPLLFTLLEAPYDDFQVIEPFTLEALIAPPTFFQRWRSLLLAGLALAGVLAALWYSRDRPALPSDLAYALVSEGASLQLKPRPLDEGSLLARLLGRVVEHPVAPAGEDRVLGWVRPVDRQLYQLRPARGVRVEPLEEGEQVRVERRLATLGVHRVYRLVTGNRSYLLRLEYR